MDIYKSDPKCILHGIYTHVKQVDLISNDTC